MVRGFKIGIRLIELDSGYERTIYESGFYDIHETIKDANRIIAEKFGSSEQIELVRNHKRRRD
jgi:hypothetical protein